MSLINFLAWIPFFLIIIFAGTNLVYADQTVTTFRDDGNATIWDGKWSFVQEWKRTSYTDVNGLALRIGHDYNYLYVLLDAVPQTSFVKDTDYSIVCITASTLVEKYPGQDDYCFQVSLGSRDIITLQGGSALGATHHFTKIQNDPRLIGVGGISDINDRYSTDLHPSYEFRIPIELIGRSDKYHLYTATYDTTNKHITTWPENIDVSKFPNIPSPSQWGDLISPDKSIPEFPWPIITLILSFMSVLIINWKKWLP